MSKFIIECPSCGSYAEASGGFLGFFATKKINCSCGHVIDVKTEKMASRNCPHCGNMVVYDQSKGEGAMCPVCHEMVNTSAMHNNMANFSCPSCSCHLSADKSARNYICPLCETEIDVQKQLAKEEISKEGLASVIKFEGDNDTLIWKHPIEDFNMGSQLIVHESQEAIFFRDGKALDLFGAGRYTLETYQLPLMEKVYKLPSDTNTTFHSEVYYINLVSQMALKWGTAEKVTFIDPLTNAPMAIGARGMMNFRIVDSRKILMKLVGTTSGLSRADLFEDGNSKAKDYFRSIVQLGVSTKLAETIRRENIDIVQIDMEKMRLSESLKEDIKPYFDDYGIEITEFVVMGIMLPQPGELGYDSYQTILKLRQKDLTKSVIETETDIKLAEMEAKKTLDIRQQANAAEVEVARRGVVTAKGETDIMQAQLEGQKSVVEAQAEVSAERLRMQLEMERKAQTAQIEAEEMRAKGYSQKDVLQADVMKAFAENQVEGGGFSMGGMGAMAGQALQMGAGFATMGAMAGVAGNMMGAGAQMGREMTGAMTGAMGNMIPGAGNAGAANMTGVSSQVAPGSFNLDNAAAVGAAGGVAGKMAMEHGNNLNSANAWTCSACGAAGITSKFCPECGQPKPTPKQEDGWTCAACGKAGITSKFCPDCGAPKPAPVEDNTWTCSTCGATGITSKFCPECGAAKQ